MHLGPCPRACSSDSSPLTVHCRPREEQALPREQLNRGITACIDLATNLIYRVLRTRYGWLSCLGMGFALVAREPGAVVQSKQCRAADFLGVDTSARAKKLIQQSGMFFVDRFPVVHSSEASNVLPKTHLT
jgi:hypothetical protein